MGTYVLRWLFAGGLYMVCLDGSSLRLTATYGLISSLTVILLGPLVGRGVDLCENRLKAAKICLLVQNTCVSVAAIILALLLGLREDCEDEDSEVSRRRSRFRAM